MLNMSGPLEISELSHLFSHINLQTIEEHVRTQIDFHLLYIVLKIHQNSVEDGSKPKQNFLLNPIIEKLTNDNIDQACKVLELALQSQVDKTEANQIYEYLKTQHQVTIINLKLMKILIEVHSDFIHVDLLENYLNICSNENEQKEEYKFFVINVLPIFLNYCDEAISLIWAKCSESQNLSLLSSCPTRYLTSDAFLNILKLDNFWSLILNELVASEGYKYKIAMFLLKLALDILKDQSNFCNSYLNFNQDNKFNLFKSFDSFCILIDVVREKQLHLIEPSLGLLNKLGNLPTVWVQLIYKKILCHPHNAVGYYGLIYIMNSKRTCEFASLFTTLNKSDDSKLSKLVFQKLNVYSSGLTDDDYLELMKNSLEVTWNPIAFYQFYKNALTRPLDTKILLEIIKNCKKVPHKYIRHGIMHLIFIKIKSEINQSNEKIPIEKFLEIIIEFMMDETYYKYATKLINIRKLIVTDEFINEIKRFLVNESTSNEKTKIKVDFIKEIVERKDLNATFTKGLYNDFKQRKYSHVVLDRMSYLYFIKATDLQEYLMQRLETNEETFSIRHMDKPSYDLISKSIGILCSNTTNTYQQTLAFEILFFMTKSNYNNVYNHFLHKIVNEKTALPPSLAYNFVNLLLKVPTNYGINNFERILQVYVEFFNSQSDAVVVRIYRNFDFVLENVKKKHLEFVEIGFNRLFHLKAREDVENSVRYLIRSVALNYKAIDATIFEFLLRRLHEIAVANSAASDLVIYYSTMYFKYLNVDYKLFPMYEFLLYPNGILSKHERAEYEICSEIYLNLHTSSPYFRAAEIRKWSLEDILFDTSTQKEKPNATVNYLLSVYKKNFNKRYFPDSTLHLQKLRIMQAFAFLLPHLTTLHKEQLTAFLIDSFTAESHQNSVRLLMQYILAQLLKENDELDIIWQTLEITSHKHTSTITALIPVIYGLDLLKDNAEFSHKVCETILVWTMGSNFKLRYFAQKLIREICYRHRNNFKFKKYDALYKAADSSLNATTTIGDNLNMDFQVFDIINREKPWKDNRKLMYIVTTYIPEVAGVCLHEWEYFKIKHFWSKYLSENSKQVEEITFDVDDENESKQIQKKITPRPDIFEYSQSTPKTNLIVVASLIESPANLGGLSRTCEIFGGTLTIDNIKALENKEFNSLSMSSERWLNINEVKVNALPEFLKKRQENGWKLVGVEQTSDSVSLENYKFDGKTLLLLGNERSGIPAPLIALMDHCVEIPQMGMIRSLNVHVAGALIIWEYTKQHLQSLPAPGDGLM